jgi:NodT family efflux transporter outer membrane factor (OMF) lipoprotein
MRSFFLFSSLFFMACASIGPRYQKPSVEVAPNYRELSPEQREAYQKFKPAHPADANSRNFWWKQFKDPELDKLEDKLNQSNQSLIAADASYRAARALVNQAQASFVPTLSLAPSFNAQSGSSTIGQTSATSRGTFSQYTVPLQASWEPDFWGRVEKQVEQTVAAAQASEADLESEKLSLQAQLAIAYYQLRAQDEMQTLFSETVMAYQRSLDLNQSLQQTGVGTEEVVIQAQTQLETVRAQATNLAIARSEYEHAIAVLTGQVPSLFSIAVNHAQSQKPTVPAEVPSQLLERRPDIAAAERNVAAANAQIGVGLAAYYPNLSLTGGAGFGSNSIRGLAEAPLFIWSLGANLAATIFDGGLRSARVTQYRAQYDEAVAQYRQTVLTSFQQVEDALAGLRILETETQQQAAAVAASERYLQIATDRYNLGLDPYLTVVQAQIALLSSRQTQVNLHMTQMTKTAQLIEVLGGDWSRSQLPEAKSF